MAGVGYDDRGLRWVALDPLLHPGRRWLRVAGRGVTGALYAGLLVGFARADRGAAIAAALVAAIGAAAIAAWRLDVRGPQWDLDAADRSRLVGSLAGGVARERWVAGTLLRVARRRRHGVALEVAAGVAISLPAVVAVVVGHGRLGAVLVVGVTLTGPLLRPNPANGWASRLDAALTEQGVQPAT